MLTQMTMAGVNSIDLERIPYESPGDWFPDKYLFKITIKSASGVLVVEGTSEEEIMINEHITIMAVAS
jgi:hypothetical protein